MNHTKPSIWFSVSVSIPVLPYYDTHAICLWLPTSIARIADDAAKKADLVDEFVNGGGTSHLQNANTELEGTFASFTFAGSSPLDVTKIKLFEQEMAIGVVSAFKDHADKLAAIAKEHFEKGDLSQVAFRRTVSSEQADSMPNTPVRT